MEALQRNTKRYRETPISQAKTIAVPQNSQIRSRSISVLPAASYYGMLYQFG